MEKLTLQTWEKLDLPENLYELLMEKYNQEKNTQTQSQKPIIRQETSKIKI